jgi:hypothetical protein
VNPKYENTFVFVNDYSAVKESQAEYKQEGDPSGSLFPPFPDRILQLTTTTRPLEPPPPCRPRNRQMLRPNLLLLPQPHSRRSHTRSNPTCNKCLDANLCFAPLTLQPSILHNSISSLGHTLDRKAKRAVQMDANLREQGFSNGVFESASSRSDLDHDGIT